MSVLSLTTFIFISFSYFVRILDECKQTLEVLVSGYGEVNFEPHNISQTNTHKEMQPSWSKLISLKDVVDWKCTSLSEISTSTGQNLNFRKSDYVKTVHENLQNLTEALMANNQKARLLVVMMMLLKT